MGFKHQLSKLISLFLIGVGLYQVVYTASLILFFYPELSLSQAANNFLLQKSLLEKAIIYYFSMVTDGFYGIFLLFKPQEEINPFHLAAGVVLGIFSFFFVTQTPLTITPVQQIFGRF